MAAYLSRADFDIGWRTVWMEARGESYEGMKAVAHVLKNRRDFKQGDRWNTISQVCLDWLQFSGWREADPNFNAALSLSENDPAARLCMRAFLEAYDEPDFTHGARHYYSTIIPAPAWAAGKSPCYAQGLHKFFNDIA